MTWFEIDLDPDTRHESIARLVAGRAAGAEQAGGPERLAAVMEEAVQEAQRRGAVLAAMFADVVDGCPVSAALVATVITARAGGGAADLPPGLARDLDGEVVELPAGPAVRHSHRQQAATGDDTIVEVETIDFYVPVPAGSDVVLLSFSTPNVESADAFAALFDSLATSVRFAG